ncbi:Na+/H+ antiporter subunit E [Lachnoclostridium sp. Marseille-P6806]|uniref:Na+/H+ antiporter subunit E n=1 Tax=Lachnoclostridium sp. Marseille-P6806 TaxID=2364793 RepID=UPI0010324D22|nr:Na+/H+ antiporter subunit E [Lachnoclostridium sp. Marseille-P6806]
MNKKISAWISTFVFCYLFWMLLVWSAEPRELVLGVLVSAGAALFAGRFLIHSRAFYLFHPVRLILLAVYVGVIFLWEVIKANIAMVKLVFSPKLSYRAGIIRIPGSDDIRSEYGLAMVSNSITLTPGTITLNAAADEEGHNYYYVHWIDVETTDRNRAGEMIKGRMERWIGRIWK